MVVQPKRVLWGLVAAQLGDAAFNAIPTQWLRDDLEHLGIPEDLRFVFPVIKSASAVGLAAGLRWHRLGRLTALALVGYFLAAMGFHACARDNALRYLPAAGMLVWSFEAFQAFDQLDSKTRSRSTLHSCPPAKASTRRDSH